VRNEPENPSYDIEAEFLSESELGIAPAPAPFTPPEEERGVVDEAHTNARNLPPTYRTVGDGFALPSQSLSLPPGDDVPRPRVSIADLLENRVDVDWREAVAIARQICQTIPRETLTSSSHPLIDPRHVEIDDAGAVRLVPGGSGGDPLVKQVGRILRALLEDTMAPVQLRLLASQAAFELPGFKSIDELSEALRQFESSEEAEAIRTAAKRGLEAKYSVRQIDIQSSTPAELPPPVQPIQQPKSLAPKGMRTLETVADGRPSRVWLSGAFRPGAAVIMIMAAVVAGYLSLDSGPATPPPATDFEFRVAAAETAVPEAGAVLANVQPSVPRPEPPPVETQQVRTSNETIAPRTAPRTAGTAPTAPPSRAESAPPLQPPPLVSTPPVARSVPSGLSVTGISVSVGSDVSDSAMRRALDLLTEGKTEEAQLAFDAIVMGNPQFRFDAAARSNPAAVAALQTSRRALLPPIMGRDLQAARLALEGGDYGRALKEGARLTAMLDDPVLGVEDAELRDGVELLLGLATAAKTRDEQRVYTSSDEGISPPTPLGRQLPAAVPIGVSKSLLGTLEILVNRDGSVEAVRLHTPANRYYDRMIVSAAKAWRYNPALRNGKPVRFLLVSTINLPEG
jgi:hypothetical protein